MDGILKFTLCTISNGYFSEQEAALFIIAVASTNHVCINNHAFVRDFRPLFRHHEMADFIYTSIMRNVRVEPHDIVQICS